MRNAIRFVIKNSEQRDIEEINKYSKITKFCEYRYIIKKNPLAVPSWDILISIKKQT